MSSAPAKIAFYLDPICPYSYKTSLWIREARKVRALEIEWRFFSLKAVNEGTNNLKESHGKSTDAFRLMANARLERGNEYVDKLYQSIGRLRHEERLDISESAVLERAAKDVGIEASLLTRALSDEMTLQVVQEDHDSGLQKGAFGVASIEVDGDGRAFFGPVISDVPAGERAGELWDHFAWLVAQPEFYEIKRERH
ncbi:MAG TPA: DsbA family protein [Chloroflexota bacterium]|nr:DsbA family protein [Chloroflexota bacterium]